MNRFHILIPKHMSDDSCSDQIDQYSEKISKAELLILDFKEVEEIDTSGLLRIHTICSKLNPECEFKIVNANPRIKHFLVFTPLKKYIE